MVDSKFSILAVDDEPTNLDLIRETFYNTYTLLFAINGQKALEIAEAKKPDLILLDIMMPDMNGYEICSKIKMIPELMDIPVIFISALGDPLDEDKAFQLGAVDYVTKPVEPILIRARVRSHLELKAAKDELKRQNQLLKENIQLREDIDSITRHDLKSPLNGIINLPNMIINQGGLQEKQIGYLQDIKNLGYKMLDMINHSMDLYKMEKGSYTYMPTSIDLVLMLREIGMENESLSKIKNVEIEIVEKQPEGANVPTEFIILGDQMLTYAMLGNLVKNALEASPENQTVTITLEYNAGFRITIHNMGAVPESIRNTFFEKYVTAGKAHGTGLGTYSARLAIETQRGTINMQSSETTGTLITLFFPDLLLEQVNQYSDE